MAITTQPGAKSTDLTTLLGTELADTFALTDDSLYINGLEGADTLTAADGVDKITAMMGAGGDSLTFSGDVDASNIQLGKGNDTAQFENFDGTVGGGDGNDSIDFNRSAEKATIKGADGNDTITFDTTLDSSYVWGNSDDDSITVTGATTGSTIYGGKQQDTITVAAATNSKFRGDKGNDTITVSGALDNVVIQGNADNDQINVSSASATKTTVFGGKGVDDINITGAAAMLIRGDDGNDDIDITANAAYTVSGGEGADSIDSNSTVAGKYFGGKGNDTITVNGVVAIAGTQNYVSGDVGDDVITGANDADSIDGGTGADTITGAGGADTIYGKAGADSINVSGGTGAILNVLGGTDNDTILIAEADLLSDDIIKGQDGTDVLQIDDAATLIDSQLKGVSTIETLEFVLNTGAAVIGANAQAAGITVVDMDSVAGDAGTLSAAAYTSAVALSIVGAAGNDSIAGGAGNDTISGGTNGEDTLTGGAGADLFVFLGTDAGGDDKILTDLGNGADNFTLSADVTAGVTATVAANYTATVATFNNALTADAVITGSGFDVNMSAVTLGTSGFKIDGTNNAATLTGSALADSITGGTAADSLTGGAGADTIDGNGGADSIAGGDGNDEFQNTVAELSTVAFTMTGGAGTDTLSITDAQAPLDLTAAAVTGMEALIFDTADGDDAADATTIDAGMFSTGAATFTITGGADGEADTLVITAKTTNFDNAAEAALADVNVAGEWFFDAAVGGNGVFTYYNEETSGITTLTLTGTTWAMGAGGATITATL